jgi:hypothetical protein
VRRVFKTKTFARWSRKAGVPDDALGTAVQEMVAGLIDADLGGHVYKKRVAMPGRGKSGGARVILGTRLEEKVVLPVRVPEERACDRRHARVGGATGARERAADYGGEAARAGSGVRRAIGDLP